MNTISPMMMWARCITSQFHLKYRFVASSKNPKTNQQKYKTVPCYTNR